ncbi:MAG: hypothetical protein ACP5J4_15070 [Anaerolineae bacterium]
MKPQKPISKPVFLAYMIVSLLAIVILWGTWLWRDAGPYAWLQRALGFWGKRESQIVGATLAFLFLFILWLVPTFVLRHFSDMPPMGLGSAQDFRVALEVQRQKQNAMLVQPPDAPERVRYFRYLGGVGIGIGVVALLLTGIVWYVSEALWTTGLVITLVGFIGGLLSVLSGRPFIFDTPKVYAISAVVRKIGLTVVIMLLVFAAGMCVITFIS